MSVQALRFNAAGPARRLPALALAALLALPAGFAASPLLAQNNNFSGLVTGASAQRVLELARAYGPAELRPATADRAEWVRAEIDGMIYTISFLNCENNTNCTSVQLRAWWTSAGAHSLEALNQWNRDRRFNSAYLDDEGNATIEFDVNLAHGVPEANFDDTLQWWRAVLRQFRDQVIDPGYAAQGGSNPGTGTEGGAGSTGTPGK